MTDPVKNLVAIPITLFVFLLFVIIMLVGKPKHEPLPCRQVVYVYQDGENPRYEYRCAVLTKRIRE